jgi:hypothetical protein
MKLYVTFHGIIFIIRNEILSYFIIYMHVMNIIYESKHGKIT